MTDRLRAAVQAALEAIQELEYSSSTAVGDKIAREAKQALRAALAEQDAEPVAKVELMERGGNAGVATVIREIYDPLREALKPGDKLYTHPPRREWVSLTGEERLQLLGCINRMELVEQTERLLKEKNAS